MKVILLVVLALLISPSSYAIYLPVYGSEVAIDHPTDGDLYISAGNVYITAPVHGDVIICGGTVVINDSVSGSILIVGGDIQMNGYTGGHIRCGGGKIRINSIVRGDVAVGAGDIITSSKTHIYGGILLGSGTAEINGWINGKITSGTGDIKINATVEDEVHCKSRKIEINGNIEGLAILSAETIVIGNSAVFNGSIRYWARDKVDFKRSTYAGLPVLDPGLKIETRQWYYLGFEAVMFLLWYLAVILCSIALIQLLLKRSMAGAGAIVAAKPGRSLGWGLLFLIAIPMIALLLIITLIGMPFGFIGLLLYGILLAFSLSITSVVGANWLRARYKHNWGNGKLIGIAFLLSIGLKLLSTTPFLGWFVVFLVTATAFGALLLNIRQKIAKPQHSI